MLCKEASKHCWVSYSVVVSGGEDDRQESREGEAEEGEKQALAGSREPRGMPCCAWLQAPPPHPVSSSLGSLGGALVGTPHCRCPMLPGCVIMGKSS